ncbi:MAG: hypothetical protein ACXWCG_13085, partial [Flavitalea sp.]
MKVLICLAYVFLSGVVILLANKLIRTNLSRIIKNKKNLVKTFLIASAIISVTYFQYWLLTGIFPLYFILMLVLMNFLARGIYDFIGAIGGFTIKQKHEKIQNLSFIYGAKGHRIATKLGYVATLFLLLSIIGTLWMYLKYPDGSPDRKVWVAFYHFTVLQVSAIVYQIPIMWPIITSEFIDDDIRNSYLTSKFS